MQYDNFINISESIEDLDIYIGRRSIRNAIKSNSIHFKGDLLDFGCGKMPYREFIFSLSEITSYTGLDIEDALDYGKQIKPDLIWDGKTIPVIGGKFDTIIATEVFEHIFSPMDALKEINRVLKKGGRLFFTVPFLWNLHEIPHDAYRYTTFSLEKLLNNAGFESISINAYGGWHLSMAQMMG